MFEVGRNRERLHDLVGELLGEDAAEACAKFFTRNIHDGAHNIDADDFKTAWLEMAEALNGKSEALVGMVGDG